MKCNRQGKKRQGWKEGGILQKAANGQICKIERIGKLNRKIK